MSDIPSYSKIIKEVLYAVPSVLEYLDEATINVIKATGYDGIRTIMQSSIFGAIFGYLSGGSFASQRLRMVTAVSRAYIETSEVGYQDGGGELPLDSDTAAWARARLNDQLAFVDQLFENLKDLRRQGNFDAGQVATDRAEGYARSLDAFYSEAKMKGGENITLEFGGGDGKEGCRDCKRLKGKRHKISYILQHDLIPRPGNDKFECHGYKCRHYWFNPKTGEEYRP